MSCFPPAERPIPSLRSCTNVKLFPLNGNLKWKVIQFPKKHSNHSLQLDLQVLAVTRSSAHSIKSPSFSVICNPPSSLPAVNVMHHCYETYLMCPCSSRPQTFHFHFHASHCPLGRTLLSSEPAPWTTRKPVHLTGSRAERPFHTVCHRFHYNSDFNFQARTHICISIFRT